MIRTDQLTKIFALPHRDVIAADHVSFKIEAGEVCVLLGPSGCGKTTILKMLNGLIPKTSGKIEINGVDIDKVNLVDLRRTIGYVIQNIGLFPNMTVEENISVVPRLLQWDKAKARSRARDLLAMVGLDPNTFLNRYPRELSGGQQQRVGVARAIAADPPILIMDEPFGAIDPINREAIQDEFIKMQEQLRKTIVFVSHDIDEAVKMADRVALFRGGKLEQYASPGELLAHPANEFVADFVGADRTLKRLPLISVRDAFDPSVAAVQSDVPHAKLASMMENAGTDHMVVCDDSMRPLGSLDLAVAKNAGATQVSQPDLKPIWPISLNANLRLAVSKMFSNDTSWLPCVDENGRYAGEITLSAITHCLGGTYRNETQPAPNGRG